MTDACAAARCALSRLPLPIDRGVVAVVSPCVFAAQPNAKSGRERNGSRLDECAAELLRSSLIADACQFGGRTFGKQGDYERGRHSRGRLQTQGNQVALSHW
jgi:hypothetical protein